MTTHTTRLLSHERLTYSMSLEIQEHQGKQLMLHANSPMDHFNLFIDENTTRHFCTETNKFANQNGFRGFILFY